MPHCTECGAEVRGTEKFCGECGTPLSSVGTTPTETRVADQKSVATLMGMAKTAELGSNNAEALEYYNRVLEIDPTIAEAWIGKGRSASWQSTLVNFRVAEGLIAFQHAISNAGEARAAISAQVTEEINKLVAALYRVAREHLEDFAALDQTWPSYLGQVGQMLDALEQARKWDPDNRVVLENIVHLTKDNIEGFKYWDNIYRVSGLHSITPEYEQVLRDMMDAAVAALRDLDENYAAPVIEKKSDGCFVVTATMGDFNHPDVITLRRFRDDWIAMKPGGRSFISLYYRIGPKIAAWIAQTTRRRRIAYRLIVRPAVYFARSRSRY